MKLYDDLMRAGVVDPVPGWSNYSWSLPNVFDFAVCFDVTNVAKHVDNHPVRPEALPSLRPPFDNAWWETSYVYRGEPEPRVRRYGAMSYVTSWGDPDRYETYGRSAAPGRYVISEKDYPKHVQERMADEVYWAVWVDAAPGAYDPGPVGEATGAQPRYLRGGVIRRSLYEVGIPLDAEGKPFLREDGTILARDLRSNPLLHNLTGPSSYHSLAEFARSGISPGFSIEGFRQGRAALSMKYIMPFLVAIGLCHCRNVEIADAEPIPERVARKREKKLGRPLKQFKVLVIDPKMTRKSSQDRPRTVSEADTALHIVRGNFAHYTDEKPLFGKYTGTFWRPAHVRGSEDHGMVFKDYKVKV